MDRRRLGQIASGAAFLAVCAIAVLIVVSQAGGGSGGDTNLEDVGVVKQQLQGIQERGTTLGDPGARVTVVEYGDLQCPVCKQFSIDTAPGLIDGVVRKGEAVYELRQFIVIGSDSTVAAKAALAAGEQGRYWNFVELFYRNQGEENSGYVTDEFLTAIARGAGVPNIREWNADRENPRWDAVLSKTRAAADSLGIASTPTIVVEGPGGTKVVGSSVVSLGDIESAIQAVG
jgi:protein-disulfide isomerase